MKKIYIYLAICAAFCACGENPTLDIAGMFSPQGPTIKTRFDHSMAYNDKVDEIHLDMQQDNYVVYTCADSHINKAHRNLAWRSDAGA